MLGGRRRMDDITKLQYLPGKCPDIASVLRQKVESFSFCHNVKLVSFNIYLNLNLTLKLNEHKTTSCCLNFHKPPTTDCFPQYFEKGTRLMLILSDLSHDLFAF